MAKVQEARKRKLDTLDFTLGEDIKGFLNDSDVFEIIVNPDTKIWIDTFSRGRVFSGRTIEPALSEQIILQVANLKDMVCSVSNPTIGTELPDGSRFQGFLPDVVPAPAFNIRKHSNRLLTLDDYVHDGIMTARQKDIIIQAIREKKNIIAAGGTKSGKTTFLNAILAEISKEPDRIVMIEDTRELQCSAEDYLPLKVTDYRDMNDLLRDTLRATPDRIVVGEVRNGEALALLKAWNTGHDGGCSTVHSSSALQTLERLEEMVMEVSKTPQQSTIAGAVDVIVYLRRHGNSRIVEEILGVDSYDREHQRYITHSMS